MRATRLWPAILLAAGGALILGCGDRSPIGVPSQAPAPQSSLIGGLPGPTGLLRCQPLPFEQTADITMSYAHCNLFASLAPKRIAYTTDGLDILDYLVSVDDLVAQQVTAELHHFSEYAIAW